MQAGSPNQMEALRARDENERGYDKDVAFLEEKGLLIDKDYIYKGEPYKYGQAWLKIAVPESVLETLRNLPETDIPYPWRRFKEKEEFSGPK